MRNLLLGIIDFRQRVLPKVQTKFQELEFHQKPDSLFVACSDSRVVPNLFASTNPGELFVVRNIGNMVPLTDELINKNVHYSLSVGAAIEFSNANLKVSDIIVCGHSECGAMKAVVDQVDFSSTLPHLHSWLKNADTSMTKLKQMIQHKQNTAKFTTLEGEVEAQFDTNLLLHDQLSQINVLQQVENLVSYKIVRQRIEKEGIQLHAWWFDIPSCNVYSFSVKKKQFILLDESKAEHLLERYKLAPLPVLEDPPWVKGLDPHNNKSKL